MTINRSREVADLLAAGFARGAIVEIDDGEDDGRLLGTRRSPSIAAMLSCAASRAPDGPVALAQADVFAAVPTADVFAVFLDDAPATALAREVSSIVEASCVLDPSPDRSRFDTFVLAAGVPSALVRRLTAIAEGADLRFEDRGADLVLTALVADPALGGAVVDGAVFLHEAHDEASFVDPDPARTARLLATLAPAVCGGTDDPIDAFGRFVSSRCASLAGRARERKAAFYAAPGGPPPSRAASSLAEGLGRLAPWVAGTTAANGLAVMAERMRGGPVPDRAALARFFVPDPDAPLAVAQHLLAALFVLRCRPDIRPVLLRDDRRIDDGSRAAMADRFAACLMAERAVDLARLAVLSDGATEPDERILIGAIREVLAERMRS